MAKNTKPTVFKRSPIVIVKDFIGIEVLAGLVYILAGFLFYYAKLYRSLPVSQYVSYQIAQAIFLFGAETFLIMYVFFRWHRESFSVVEQQLIHRQGVLWRQKMAISLSTVHTISYRQGPLGKLVKYGTIQLIDPALAKPISFRHIPDPQDVVAVLTQAQAGRQRTETPKGEASVPAGKFLKLDSQGVLTVAEHEGLEFKSTFRWDMRANRVNKDLEKSAMKTVAAFLNTRGGHLVIGVDDTKNVVGMELDYQTLGKPNGDGFENHFSHIFHNMIGAEFRQFVRLTQQKQDDKEYCVVAVAPAPRPVYLKSDENEEFYIRTGNGTTSLKFSQAAGYIENRFRKRK